MWCVYTDTTTYKILTWRSEKRFSHVLVLIYLNRSSVIFSIEFHIRTLMSYKICYNVTNTNIILESNTRYTLYLYFIHYVCVCAWTLYFTKDIMNYKGKRYPIYNKYIIYVYLYICRIEVKRVERTTSRVVVRISAFYNSYSCQVSSKILDSGSLSRFWSVKDWLKSLKDFWLVSSSTSWTIDNSIGSLLPAYYPETPYPPNHIKTHPSSSLAFLIRYSFPYDCCCQSMFWVQTMTELVIISLRQ